MASYRETIDVKYETGKPLLDAVADGKVPLQTPDYVPFEDEGFEEPDDFVEPPEGGVQQHQGLEPEEGQQLPEYQCYQPNALDADMSQGDELDLDAEAGAVQVNMIDHWRVAITVGKEYKCWAKARQSPHREMFDAARRAELKQLIQRGVMKPSTMARKAAVAPNETLYGSLMTFLTKAGDGGELVPKARLCLDGRDDPETDLSKIRTCTPFPNGFRSMVARAAGENATLYTGDVPNAFGQSPADKTRWMRMPPDQREFDENGEEIIYEIENLYGGRCSGRNYQNHMVCWLVHDLGFVQCPHDPAMFRREAKAACGATVAPERQHKKHKSTKYSSRRARSAPAKIGAMTLSVWIDDCVWATRDTTAHEWFSAEMNAEWNATGEYDCKIKKADFVIGLGVTQVKKGIALDQRAFADKLLAKWGMADCNGKSTPLSPGTKVTLAESPTLEQ